jgi:hypothetical protein
MKWFGKMVIKSSGSVKTYDEALDNPDLYTPLFIPYPTKNEDIQKAQQYRFEYDEAGCVRYDPLFHKMYGSSAEEVKNNLVKVLWLPRSFNQTYKLPVTKVNGMADKFRAISHELDDMVKKS